MTLTAAELMRITVEVIALKAYAIEETGNAFTAFTPVHGWKMDFERFTDNSKNRETWVKRIIGVLKNDLNFFAIRAEGMLSLSREMALSP